MKTDPQKGIFILRISLAILFLWFGFSQLLDASSWISWVPGWAENLTGLEPEMIVLLNGGFEIAMGVLLALGLYTRIAAIFLALHVALLVFEIGLTPIGFRDFAIMGATFALALLGPDEYSLDA
ncbi:MAG: DoxX family protein [Minisyncoccia bacterium]